MNRARGETALETGERTYRLCLTLGALAEIETALGSDSLGDLDVRLRRLKTSDVIAVLAALMRGGGEAVSDSDVASLAVSPANAVAAIARAFTAAGLGAGAETDAGNASPPQA